MKESELGVADPKTKVLKLGFPSQMTANTIFTDELAFSSYCPLFTVSHQSRLLLTP